MALIAAVRMMQIVLARDGATAQAIADAIDPIDVPALQAINPSLEGRTAKLKNPHPATTLAWLSWIAAGSADGRATPPKDTGPPGPRLSPEASTVSTACSPDGTLQIIPRLWDSPSPCGRGLGRGRARVGAYGRGISPIISRPFARASP